MWLDYKTTVAAHTVVGDLRLYRDFYSPQLQNHRDLLVWLPPGYAEGQRRYPVLYMHDGQNLFDEHTTNFGEWRVDETMTQLSAEGLEAIIVGLPNLREERRAEYSPYPDASYGFPSEGKGHPYMRFIVETVKPFIDHSFHTRPEVAATGIAGSSMGGLISLYGLLAFPDVFGYCGAFSTAYWFGERGLLGTIRQRAQGAGRIYLDVGTAEGPTLAGSIYNQGDLDAAYLHGVREVRDALIAGGYVVGQNLMYVETEGAVHNEAAWARRLPDALRYLLPRLA